ncbi:short transient receptor potential channel 6-like [Physella acuta]|uniref:short transient receptor potential channel 6-like n=1 Tax=Physella acuta TaxID=109671 RepID=UPI0027DCF23E|nr:short transient receptor potential channel 6-like [Physella acuta]
MSFNSSHNKWLRRRVGSTRYSMISHASQDSSASKTGFVDLEDEFLHACEFGDVHNARRILRDFVDTVNVDCMDALGRTALRLAVKNEHLEIVEVLLEKSNQHHIYEAVLQAISAGHTQIAETILKHRRYLEMWKERRKLGDMDGFYKAACSDAQFSPDITPMILAAQNNNYEVVQLLLLRGETIHKPHKFGCSCQECRNRMKFDQLRLAKYRLNAYRGLASEAYISLSSKDPILTAFELAAELRRLSRVEKHFKREYRDLADQLSDYVVKLLDRIRTQKELELVLNKTGKPHQEKFESLARFKLALKYDEKKFIAHPSCQQRIVRAWYTGMGRMERASWTKRIAMIMSFICAYPVLVFLHIFFPRSKGGNILQLPVVKFSCHAASFVIFLLLIVVSTIESSKSVSKYRTLSSEYSSVAVTYKQMRVYCSDSMYGEDFPLRASSPSITELLMTFWIFGMLVQECSQLFTSGLVEHISIYNGLDFILLICYITSTSLRYWTMLKFHQAIDVLSRINNQTCTELSRFYWLNTDRLYWAREDPMNLLEGLFAMGNIISFFRISYLLPANEILGPLQISLGRMLKDIAKFGALFILVIFAFMVGLHNLYWYYSERVKIELDNLTHPKQVPAEKHFGGVLPTFRTVFWTLFGRGEPEVVKLGEFNNTFTEDIGYVIYGAYNVAMVTVLLNMLVAMMTRSFTLIAEDSDREWKFARSRLYTDYIGNIGVLPVPLNILGAPNCLFQMIFSSHSIPDTLDIDLEGEMVDSIQGDISSRFLYNNENTKSVSVVTTPFDTEENTTLKAKPSSSQSQEKLTYRQTMERIVQRYIFDLQREAEVTEDDFEEIKHDISSFRYDVIHQMAVKTNVQDELMASMNTILNQMQDLKEKLHKGKGSI